MTTLTRPRLLIVDDDENMRWMIEIAAEKTGRFAALEMADDGDVALARVLKSLPAGDASRMPDVILTDLNMQRMSGLDLLREIRRQEHTRPIVVFVITLSDRPADSTAAAELGCDGFFRKPPDIEGLMAILEELTERWHDRQEPAWLPEKANA